MPNGNDSSQRPNAHPDSLVENASGDSGSKFEAYVTVYNNLDTLKWQIPSFFVAITAGILGYLGASFLGGETFPTVTLLTLLAFFLGLVFGLFALSLRWLNHAHRLLHIELRTREEDETWGRVCYFRSQASFYEANLWPFSLSILLIVGLPFVLTLLLLGYLEVAEVIFSLLVLICILYFSCVFSSYKRQQTSRSGNSRNCEATANKWMGCFPRAVHSLEIFFLGLFLLSTVGSFVLAHEASKDDKHDMPVYSKIKEVFTKPHSRMSFP